MRRTRTIRSIHALLALAMLVTQPAPASVAGAASIAVASEMPCGGHERGQADGARHDCCGSDCTMPMAACFATCTLAQGALPATLAFVAVTATPDFDHGVAGLAPPALTTPPLLRPPAR